MHHPLLISLLFLIPVWSSAQVENKSFIYEESFKILWERCDFDGLINLCDSLSSVLETTLDDGHIEYWKATALAEKGNVDQAIDLLQKSMFSFLASETPQRDHWARAALRIADLLFNNSEISHAAEIAQQVISAPGISVSLHIRAITFQAYLKSEQEKQSAADSILLKAEHLLDQVDSISEATLGFYLISTHIAARKRQVKRQLDHARKCVAIAERLPHITESSKLNAKTTLARSLNNAGYRTESIKLFQELLNEFTCVGLQSMRVKSVALNNLAGAMVLDFRYAEAVALLKESISLQSEFLVEDHNWIVRSHSYLADYYSRLRDTAMVKAEAQIIFSMLERLNLPDDNSHLARLYFALQLVEVDVEKRIKYLEHALRISEKVYGPASFQKISAALSLSRVTALAGDAERAIELSTKVNDLMQKMGGHPIIPDLYEENSKGAIRRNELISAQLYLDSAFSKLSGDFQMSNNVMGALASAAKVFNLSGQVWSAKWNETGNIDELIKAQGFFEQSIEAIDQILPVIDAPREKHAMVNLLYDNYQDAIDNLLLIRMQQPNQELDNNLNSLVTAGKNVSMRAFVQERLTSEVKDSLKRINSKIVLLEYDKANENGQVSLTSINEQIAQLKNTILALKKAGRTEEKLNNLDGTSLALDHQSSESIYINYFISRGILYSYVQESDKLTLVKHANYKEVVTLIKQYIEDINLWNAALNKSIEHAQHLYQLLIEPLPITMSGKVVLLPDREIHYIPFEALINDHGKYLLEMPIEISYAFSSNPFHDFKGDNKVDQIQYYAPSYENEIPFLDTVRSKVLAAIVKSGGLQLATVGDEVERIQKIVPLSITMGTTCTKELFLARVENADILHLSMHAIANGSNPELSYLLFEYQEDYDRSMLFLGEIYPLRIPAQLAFLAACKTGSGKIIKGEGAISFARALQYAGVSSTITGLWNLPDQSTSDISIRFYQNLADGQSKSAALKNAKLHYLTNQIEPDLKHPYFWAGLVLHGNVEPVSFASHSNWHLYSLAVISFLGFIFYLFYKTRSSQIHQE